MYNSTLSPLHTQLRTVAVEQKTHRLLSHLDLHLTPNITTYSYVTMDSYFSEMKIFPSVKGIVMPV